MITAGQLLNDNVKGERIRNVISDLFHLLVSLSFVFTGKAKLAKLITTPRKEFCVLWRFSAIFTWLDKLEACPNFTVVDHFYLFLNYYN